MAQSPKGHNLPLPRCEGPGSITFMTPQQAVRAACAIIDMRRANGSLVAGIDGAGGAGKSTLARGISDALAGRVSTIRCDDFYRPLTGAQYSHLTPQEAYENYFDWRRLRDEALMPLRAGEPARYQRYDWSTDGLAEWIEIEPREIVLVEGVFSLRPELRPRLEVAIFIETPRDERMRRMSARPQGGTSWMDSWMAAEDWYLVHLAPHRTADLVVEGF
jgi:uridine kinase